MPFIPDNPKGSFVPDNTPSTNTKDLKSPWSAVNADIPYQMTVDHPIASAIAQAGQDVATVPANFFNQLLLNAPRAVLEKAGYGFPKAENKTVQKAANIAGLVGGLKNPLKIQNPVVAGAAYGALYSNKDNVGLDSQSLLNRASGAGIGLAGGAILAKAGQAFNSGNVINRFIGTKKKDFLFGKNPGQAVADEGIIANSPEDLSTKIGVKLDEYGNKINDTLKSYSSKTVNIDNAVDPLNDAISKAAATNDQALINRLNDAKTAISNKLSVDPTGKIQVQYNRDLKALSPQEATEVKRIVGEMTKFTGMPSADTISNNALLKVYGVIRSSIEKVAPEVKGLNQQYANLKSAQIAIQRKDFSKPPLMGVLGGIGRGALVGLVAGHGNPATAALGAVAEPILERATNNATIKTSQAAMYKTLERAKKATLANNQEMLGIANILNSNQNQ